MKLPCIASVWCSIALAAAASAAGAQPQAFGACKPVSQRTTEIGCWILTNQPVGRIDSSQVFWYLDAYATRADAERARGPRGTVLDALGRTWLLTIERADWRPVVAGTRVAEIGPLPVSAGRSYSALFMEAVMTPGMTSAVHRHSGPEAWYTTAGETCLETPTGRIIGRRGEPVIVPGGPPMLLTATGIEQRRAIVLILHDSAQPPTTMAHDWKPKGLCAR